MIRGLKTYVRKSFRDLSLPLDRKRIRRILNQNGKPQNYDSETLFEKLQTYPERPEYGYTPFDNWERASERVLLLMKKAEMLRECRKKVLEVGCGDGMLTFLLTQYGHEVSAIDFEDWRDGRAKVTNFINGDLNGKLPFEDDSFDFICSFNTFEHLKDPGFTLSELIRIGREDAMIYLHFNPIYCSPWGLHAYRTIKMPYPQFLFSEDFLQKKLTTLGIRDLGRMRNHLQPLNKWSVAQYENLWAHSGGEILFLRRFTDTDHLHIVKNYPKAFAGKNLTYEDLTTSGYQILLKIS